jgi:hypothetical protein
MTAVTNPPELRTFEQREFDYGPLCQPEVGFPGRTGPCLEVGDDAD